MKARSALRGFLAALLLCTCAAAHAEQYAIPLFVSASPGGDPQGVLRLANDADAAAAVSIYAIGDTGIVVGLATLTLDASAAVELTAEDLESGNAAKELATGFGPLGGNVRLLIDSDTPIVPSAYVRGPDGALAPMHATVVGTAAGRQAAGASSTMIAGQASGAGAAQTAYRHDVHLFHPASNATQPSCLRLINPGDTAAQVTIEARDDFGTPASGGAVQLALPAGNARTLTAQQLEAGDATVLTGQLGAGVGNWRLSVTADRPIDVVHVTVGPAGDWRNLSTTAIDGWAPGDAAAFEARFLDHLIVDRDGQSTRRPEFLVQPDGRIRRTVQVDGAGVTVYEGPYRYERVGRDAGRLTLSGDGTEWYLYFSSPSTGRYSAWTIDRASGVESWSGGAWSRQGIAATPPDLGFGPSSLVFALGTAIDPATLPAASGGDGELVYGLSPAVPGLNFDPATRELSGTPAESGRFLVTYRATDAAGASDRRYFTINVLDEEGGGEPGSVLHETGGTLSDLPAGVWEPDVLTAGSVTASTSGDSTEVAIGHLEYLEQGGNRYTCLSAMGCTVRDRELVSGSVLQTVLAGGGGDGNVGGDGGGTDNGADQGDDPASATAVGAYSDTAATLDAGDVDYFRIDLVGAGTLEVYSTGSTDTYGQLEDAGGAVLGRNDDGGEGRNFRLSEVVAAGTYFVRIRGYSNRVTGGYTLHVRFIREGDCHVGLRVNPGESCLYPDTDVAFSVNEDGQGQFLIFTSAGLIDLANSTVNPYDFAASHQGNGVWRIDRIGVDVMSSTGATGDGSNAGGDGNGANTGGSGSYTTLAGLRVSAGRVQLGFLSAGGCLSLNGAINGVTYTTHTSRWQRRAEAASPWADIPGTERQGELCAYNPTASGEYRMVADVTVDGTRGEFVSENTIVVP